MRLSVRTSVTLDALEALARTTQNMRPVLEDVADETQEALHDRLRRGVGPPLTARHAARKAARGLSTRPLLGGELERSIAGQGRYAVKFVNRDDMRVGTKDPVANFHVTGNSSMPARPPVDLTAPMRRRMKAIIEGALRASRS